MIKYFVYIVYLLGFKVGICCGKNLFLCWFDQGVVVVIIIFEVSERLFFGFVEIVFKEYVFDRINWWKMLLEDEFFSDVEFNVKVNLLVDVLKDVIDQF